MQPARVCLRCSTRVLLEKPQQATYVPVGLGAIMGSHVLNPQRIICVIFLPLFVYFCVCFSFSFLFLVLFFMFYFFPSYFLFFLSPLFSSLCFIFIISFFPVLFFLFIFFFSFHSYLFISFFLLSFPIISLFSLSLSPPSHLPSSYSLRPRLRAVTFSLMYASNSSSSSCFGNALASLESGLASFQRDVIGLPRGLELITIADCDRFGRWLSDPT